jgi:hypothetical protein
VITFDKTKTQNKMKTTTENKMKTTIIFNKTWKVKDLNLIASTKSVKDLITEYKKDSNCRPIDWIANINISDLEKASFVNACLN